MITMKIQGMTCQHCVAAVTKALAKVPGVTKVVEVDLASGEAIVEGAPEVASLTAAVEEEGYQAEVVR